MRLLNIKETSEILGIRPRTLYQWKWKGKDFPFIQLGRSLRVSELDLVRFIEKRKISKSD